MTYRKFISEFTICLVMRDSTHSLWTSLLAISVGKPIHSTILGLELRLLLCFVHLFITEKSNRINLAPLEQPNCAKWCEFQHPCRLRLLFFHLFILFSFLLLTNSLQPTDPHDKPNPLSINYEPFLELPPRPLNLCPLLPSSKQQQRSFLTGTIETPDKIGVFHTIPQGFFSAGHLCSNSLQNSPPHVCEPPSSPPPWLRDLKNQRPIAASHKFLFY